MNRLPTASPRRSATAQTQAQLRLLATMLLVSGVAGAGLTLVLDDALIATAIVGCLFVVLLSLFAPTLATDRG